MLTATSIRAGLHSARARLGELNERFSALWRLGPQSIVAIAIGNGGRAAIVELAPVGERYLATTREVTLRATAPRDIAEELTVALAKEGWEDALRVLVASEPHSHGYVLRLPPNIDAAGAHEAAYWEMVGKMVDDGIVVDEGEVERNYQYAGFVLNGERYYGSAVERQFIRDYTAAFREAECELANIVIPAPSGERLTELARDYLVEWQESPQGLGGPIALEALYGGLSYLAPPPEAPASCTLLPREGRQSGYNYRRLSAVLIAVTFAMLMLASLFDLYQLHEADVASSAASSELALKSPDVKRMQLLTAAEQEVTAREQILTQLSAGSISWYGVLVHFGTMTVEGVQLERLELRGEHTLYLEGRAATYEALAEFIARFEQDRDFFPHGPLLQNTATEASGLRFALSLEL